MARIVPARPCGDNRAEEEAIFALESSLDDAFVIIQRGPAPGSILVAHPDLGLCALACAAGLRRWDPDAGAFQGADAHQAARAASKALAAVTRVPIGSAAFLPDTPRRENGSASVAHGAGDIIGAVARALELSAPMGVEAVDALIQFAAVGSAPYARGEITAAQRAWRADTGSVPFVPPEPSSGTGPGPMAAGDAIAVALSAAGVAVPASDDMAADDPLLRLIRQTTEAACANRNIFVHGVAISPAELGDPDFFLPALLVAAAEDWAPVVARKAGAGGFFMRLKSDAGSILGYRVSSLEPSAPLLLLLPLVDRIRRAVKTGADGAQDIWMDETAGRFCRWLKTHRLDTGHLENLAIRLALK